MQILVAQPIARTKVSRFCVRLYVHSTVHGNIRVRLLTQLGTSTSDQHTTSSSHFAHLSREEKWILFQLQIPVSICSPLGQVLNVSCPPSWHEIAASKTSSTSREYPEYWYTNSPSHQIDHLISLKTLSQSSDQKLTILRVLVCLHIVCNIKTREARLVADFRLAFEILEREQTRVWLRVMSFRCLLWYSGVCETDLFSIYCIVRAACEIWVLSVWQGEGGREGSSKSRGNEGELYSKEEELYQVQYRCVTTHVFAAPTGNSTGKVRKYRGHILLASLETNN